MRPVDDFIEEESNDPYARVMFEFFRMPAGQLRGFKVRSRN